MFSKFWGYALPSIINYSLFSCKRCKNILILFKETPKLSISSKVTILVLSSTLEADNFKICVTKYTIALGAIKATSHIKGFLT